MEAGKVMGLAPLGFPEIPVDAFFEINQGNFYFRNALPEKFAHNDRWPLRGDEYMNLAASVQIALEEALLCLIGRLRKLQSSQNLCYAGGVALNSVANERIVRRSGFQRVHITPAAEDSGAAIGAAYYALWRVTGQNSRRKMAHDAHGQPYSTGTISGAVKNATGIRSVLSTDPIADAADLLCEGKIVGWFDGRSEIGPRALGQRSILCDPRRASHKDLLNRKVKKRESFRPFAPAILREVKPDYTEEGRRRNLEGDVVLEIVVKSDGSVGNVKLLQGLGAGLDQRATDAVRQWRFSPAKRYGTPVDVIVEVAMEFKLR